MSVFATEETVSYEDFLRLVDRYGELGGAEFKFQKREQAHMIG